MTPVREWSGGGGRGMGTELGRSGRSWILRSYDRDFRLPLSEFWSRHDSLKLSQIEARRGHLYSPVTLDKRCHKDGGVNLGEETSFSWRQFLEKDFSCELSVGNISVAGEVSASELKGNLGGISLQPLQGMFAKDEFREVSTVQVIQGLMNYVYRYGLFCFFKETGCYRKVLSRSLSQYNHVCILKRPL